MKNLAFSVHCYINIEITVIICSASPPPVLCDFCLSCFKISILAAYTRKSGGVGIRWLESGACKNYYIASFCFYSSILIT
jgi:hypothetical protein